MYGGYQQNPGYGSGVPPPSGAGYGGPGGGGGRGYGGPPPTRGYGSGGPPPSGYPPSQGGYGGGYPPQGGPPPQGGYGRGGPSYGQQGSGYPSSSGPSGYGAQGYPPSTGGYGAQGYPPSTGGYGGGPPQMQQQVWAMQYYDRNDSRELQELRKWFASVDIDGNGSISASELANVAIGGVRLGIDISIQLVRIFDVDNNGEIDFQEYAALHKFLLSMQSTFKQGDKDGNGRLDANEIHNALMTGGFTMSYQSSRALYNKFNTTGYGLDMQQFIGMVAHVAMTKSAFEFRDRERRGYVALSFDQLLEFSATV